MKSIGNVLWGIVFVLLGVIFGLNALEITNIDVFFDGWWTLFIIVPCFIDLFKDRDKTGNIIGLLIGVALLLCCQDLLEFDLLWKLAFPMILIIIGCSFIFKDILHGKVKKEIRKLNKTKKEKQEYCATFSEQKLDFSEEEFKGCDLTAVFGGIRCDVSDSVLHEDVVINACSIFGGIDLFVPKDVHVKVTSTSIFGGVSNKTRNGKKESKKTIYINATCLFGGVDIK